MNLLEQFAREAQQRAYEAALLAEQRASERFFRLRDANTQSGKEEDQQANRDHNPDDPSERLRD